LLSAVDGTLQLIFQPFQFGFAVRGAADA